MKTYFLLILLLLTSSSLLYSQKAKNLDDKSSRYSRTLYFSPIDKKANVIGFNKVQRDAIFPSAGYVIYNTSTEGIEYYNGIIWRPLNARVKPLSITTTVASNITATQASSGGTISNAGSLKIIARGICVSTHTTPTIADLITSDGAGTGNFTSRIKGLIGKTTYYVRAYATHSAGTEYGNELSFKTHPFNLLSTYKADTVTLKIEDYQNTGGVEWQESVDTLHWTTIADQSNDTYQFIYTKKQYYRAIIHTSATDSQPTLPKLVNLQASQNPFGTLDPSYVNLIDGYNGSASFLILVDQNGYMWFLSNVNLYRCSVATFKANLVPVPHPSETRYSFSILKNCRLIQQGVNLRSIKQVTNGYVGRQSFDDIEKLYYFNGNQFVASTIPTGGHNGRLRVAWNFDTFGQRIVSSGYYVNYAKGRVLFSNDGGVNFKTIFDVQTSPLMPSNLSNVHIHGCHIDRWHPSRIWVLLGDYSIQLTPYKVIYCDNPQDPTPVWNTLNVDIDMTVQLNEQYCSAFSTQDLVLFGTDMQETGIYTMQRDINQRKLALYISSTLSHIPGSWSQNELNGPILFYNQATDTPSVPSQIWGTLDGVNYYKLYQDTVAHTAYSNPNVCLFRIKNDVFAFQNEGKNLRFPSSAGSLLWGTINMSLQYPEITNVTAVTTDASVTITATINPNGTKKPELHLGLTDLYNVTVVSDEISSTSTVTFTVGGLTQNTQYHYQIKTGETYTEDAICTTQSNATWVIPIDGRTTGTPTPGTMVVTCSEDVTPTTTGDVAISVVRAVDGVNKRHTISINCPNNGKGTIVFPDRTKIISLGSHQGLNNPSVDFYAGVDASMPILSLLVNNIPLSVTKIRQSTELATSFLFSGSEALPSGLTYLLLKGSNIKWNYSGALPNGLTYLNLNGDYIAWSYDGLLPPSIALTVYLNSYRMNWTGLDFSGGGNISATCSLINFRQAKLSSADMVTLLTSMKNRVGGLPSIITINDYADYANPPQSVRDAVAALKLAKPNITTVNLGQ